MKSTKSKSKTPIRTVSKPPPQQKPRRTRRVKGPYVPKREITVNDLHKKAVFNIGNLDSQLGRALVLAFGSPNYRLTQSSLLLDLKPKWMRLEQPKHHTLDTKEAVNLFTHLTRKRRGNANPMQQLEQLEAIMKSYTLESKDLEGDLEEERFALNREIDHVRRTIKTIYVELRNKLKEDFETSEDHFKASLLEWKIRQIGVELLDLTIVAIREVDFEKVEVIFEQPYPEKTCLPAYLMQVLGQSRYNAKKINFARHYRTTRLWQCSNSNFIVCHNCKEPLTDTYLRCHNHPSSTFTPTIHNSPNVHERHLLSVDYLYTKNPNLTEQQLIEELDYLKYSELNGRKVCNRFICNKCSEHNVVLDSMDEVSKYVCPFCNKTCTCPSCTLAHELVTALALYKHILKRNYQDMDKYKQLINFVNLDTHSSVEVFRTPRNSFASHPTKKYQEYYLSLIDEFCKTNDAMNRMQSEVVTAFPYYAEAKIMITDYMSQVRAFVLSIRKEKKKLIKPSSKKSLARVREQNKRYLQLMQKKKEQSQLQETLNSTPTNDRTKQIRMKLKLISCGQQSQKTHRYRVPFESFRISEHEMFIYKCEKQEIVQQVLKMSKTVEKEDLKRFSMIKNVFPFDPVDYEMAINVRPECKILDEKDLMLRKAATNDIAFPENHDIYGFKASTKITCFYENAADFCDAMMNDDESSSSDEGEEEDLENLNPGSVSISSFLERQLGVESYRFADDIADVSHYESEGSSFVVFQQGQPQGPATDLPAEEEEIEDEWE